MFIFSQFLWVHGIVYLYFGTLLDDVDEEGQRQDIKSLQGRYGSRLRNQYHFGVDVPERVRELAAA